MRIIKTNKYNTKHATKNKNINYDPYAVYMLPSGLVDTKPIAFKHDISINDVIGAPQELLEAVRTIRNAGPNDVIHLFCNSPGGSLYTTTEILSAMLQTEAHIITELTGEACSAMAIIFLAGDEFRVSDDAVLMNHGASYGVYGTQQQVYDNVVASQKQLTKLAKKYYEGFLTPEEIERLLEGKEYWMDAEEVIQRLENRDKVRQESQIEEMKKCGCEECKQTLSMIVPDSLELEDFIDEDYPTREELETWEKSDLIDFILGEDIEEEDSEDSVIPVDVTLPCTQTEEDVYSSF